jgi:hypothetical protein
VPLTDLAVEALREQTQLAGNIAYLFPSDNAVGHQATFKTAWGTLRRTKVPLRVRHQGFNVQNAVLSKEQTMKLARVRVIAAAILAVATVAWAQKPDFSGTWTLDPASAPAAGGEGVGRGGGGGALGNGPATVKQTADALTIERTMGDATVTLTYKLDGTESRNTTMGRGGQQADSVSTANWDGPKLTIVTKQEMDGQVAEFTQVWTVEGSTLTVETTNARGTQKRVYKK